jgi:ribonuclease HI
MRIDQLEVLGDSKLVVEQVMGRFKVKSPVLQPLFDQVMALRWTLPFGISHVGRGENAEADALARRASEKGAKKKPRSS